MNSSAATAADTPLRLALIGCGEVGRLRAAALDRVGAFQLVAVSDLDAGRARAVAAAHGGAVETDWRAVLHAGVDAVIVSTPPSLHAEMGVAALRAGKHVLCEKPLARTPEECHRLLQAAAKSGRCLATGFNFRFFPSIREARRLLETGLIGELDHLRGYAGYAAVDRGHPWLFDVDVVGGGALRDNGIHLIDLARYFLGEVAEVKGFASSRVWGLRGCEDNGLVLLRSPAGRLATLHASWTEWRGYRFVVELYGTRGCIRASCFPMRTWVVWTPTRGGPVRRRTYLFPLVQLRERLHSYRWVVTRSFGHELHAFSRVLRGEATALATGYDGLRAVEIAAAVPSPASPAVLVSRVAGD